MIGFPGVVFLSFFIIPAMLKLLPEKPGISARMIIGISILQSSVLLALAVWAGSALALRVGLSAPFIAELVGKDPAIAPKGALLPSLGGGGVGAIIIIIATRFAPDALSNLQARFTPPLHVRILYGGSTEELLTRWGLMSLILWALWKTLQAGSGPPEARYVWTAIVVSAVLFGVLHLPVVGALAERMTPFLLFYVVIANALFGVVAGFLFWSHGLESAMVAHASAHLFSRVTEPLWR